MNHIYTYKKIIKSKIIHCFSLYK